MRTSLVVNALIWLLTAMAAAEPPGRNVLKLEIDGAKLEGLPLASSGEKLFLLDREGRLWDFDSADVGNYQQTTTAFHAHSATAMKSRLAGEFGKAFEVTATGHYLVVHPRGQRSQWAQRFEDLYRSFIHYFQVRGLKPSEPEFPLVAVVLPTRREFVRYAARDGSQVADGLLGYYSPTDNRVAMYDAEERDWTQNADTIIHEATHQTAFNTGVHSRFAPTPRWVAEGLGTLFEAPGVWNARSNTRDADRINPGRLAQFKAYQSRRRAGVLAELVSSDRLFADDGEAAYAESWAFTYFLVETRPRDYTRLLRLTAARPAFRDYSSAERLRDFTSVFGENFRMLDAQFLRFMAGVK